MEQNTKGEIVTVRIDERGTDDLVQKLKSLTTLRDLSLMDSKITEASVEILKSMKHLKLLNLEDTGLSKSAVSQLEQALPDCEISPP